MNMIKHEEPKVATVCGKVTLTSKVKILKFCRDRKWKVGAFIRVAIEESITKVLKEEANTVVDEASGN